MPFDWRPFLEQWSRELIEAAKREEWSDIPAEVLESGWLGYDGATEAQIAAAEARLDVKLPPSYREFLLVSNGWRKLGGEIGSLLPLDEIQLFPVRNQGWFNILEEISAIMSDKEYYGGYPTLEHLRLSFEISKAKNRVALLDPLTTAADGEWQAVFMAGWVLGASRYSSFRELMQHEYQTFLQFDQKSQIYFRPNVEGEKLLKHTAFLIEKLKADIPNRRPLQSAPDKTQESFVNSWYETAENILIRAQEVIDTTLSAETLRDALMLLADTLNNDAQEIDQRYPNKNAFDPEKRGQMVAWRKAAQTIRYFLKL